MFQKQKDEIKGNFEGKNRDSDIGVTFFSSWMKQKYWNRKTSKIKI